MAYADEGRPAYRMPNIYNPNPVAGRLYLQPIDNNEDQCINGFKAEIACGSAADYNIYFVEYPSDPRMTVNSRFISVRASYGARFLSDGVESGAIIRSHQDERETLISNMLKNYHEFMGFGNIPEDGQYYGRIGNNTTEVIGKSGDIFLTTFQMYAKIQILKDGGYGTRVPNFSIKITSRMPLSGKTFDTTGTALSAGLSKQVSDEIYLIGAADVVFQDIDAEDFNADNLHVKQWASDFMAGVIWDIGETGAWYVSPAFRVSSERVVYKNNPDSAGNAYCTHLSITYRKALEKEKIMEFFMDFNEDIPGFGHGLEPDFSIQTGISVQFDNM
ncbi:MAG: hypothetical protein KJ737_17915 [Proteobacteria bacterium]|nr:hypothetical protein [Pseudomonadota bacterium]